MGWDGWDGWDGLDGWDGWDGLDGPQKCPLIFFILRYIKHYTSYILIYIYKKCPGKFLVGLKIWTSWGSG